MKTVTGRTLEEELLRNSGKWLITGVGGFVGSNILEKLLISGQKAIGLDNLSAECSKQNLESVKKAVGEGAWSNFTFCKGDIRSQDDCRKVCHGVDYVLHQAAFVSVSGSIKDPALANDNNVTGFLNILTAVRDSGAKRFIYATSAAVYGDNSELPNREKRIGRPLSPYAASKRINEVYAESFGCCYGMYTVGLRYFNVYGKRQNPNGEYAAVIPKWVIACLGGGSPSIFGDGESTRDFCHIEDIVRANLLAALTKATRPANQVFNIASGRSTSLNELYSVIVGAAAEYVPEKMRVQPGYGPFRKGDIRYSSADISKAGELLSYEPGISLEAGIRKTIEWFVFGN